MYFVGIEDMTGRVELLVFGKTAERTGDSWIEDEVVIVDARISQKEGTLRCIAEGVERISEHTLHQFARAEKTRAKSSVQKVSIVPDEKNTLLITIKNDAPEKTIENLSLFLRTIPSGTKKVAVCIEGTVLQTTFSLDPTEEHLLQLQNLSGIDSVSSGTPL